MKLLDVAVSPRDGGGVTITLAGELDLSTLDQLQDSIDEVLAARPDPVVLDLRELTFLDSSGLRAMLRLHVHQHEAGARLVLVQGPRRVRRVLELTGATEELNIVADPAEVDHTQPDLSAEAG